MRRTNAEGQKKYREDKKLNNPKYLEEEKLVTGEKLQTINRDLKAWIKRKRRSCKAQSAGVLNPSWRTQFQQCSYPCENGFSWTWRSSRKRRRIFHEKMSSKFKEPERKKESLRRKTQRLCKIIQRGKKTPNKLTHRKLVSKVSENSYCTEKC